MTGRFNAVYHGLPFSTETTQHVQHFIWRPLLYSTEKILKFCNVEAIKGRASDAVSSVYMYTAMLSWTPGCGVLVRVQRMWVRVVPILPAKVQLFYLQTQCSETLTMKTVILIGRSKWVVKWLLQTQYKIIWNRLIKEANIWNALLRLHKPSSRYLSLRRMLMDSTSYRSGHFSILTSKYFACHLDEPKFWPLPICRTCHWAALSLSRKDITMSFKPVVSWGTMGADIKIASGGGSDVFVGNSEIFSFKFYAFCFTLMFPPLSLDILKTFCTVSDDSLFAATVLS